MNEKGIPFRHHIMVYYNKFTQIYCLNEDILFINQSLYVKWNEFESMA